MTERSIVVSPQALTFCKALAATTARVGQLLEQGTNAGDTGVSFNIYKHIVPNVNLIVDVTTELSTWLQESASLLLDNRQADNLAIGRAVGRFEQIVGRMIDGYIRLQSSPADDGIHAQSRALVAAIYRHHLRQIVTWFNDLTAAIDDPAAWLASHPDDNLARPTLVIELDLSPPPELRELVHLSRQVAREATTGHAQIVESNAPDIGRAGFFDHVGALTFALALGSR